MVLGGIAAISVVALNGGTTQTPPNPIAPAAKRGPASPSSTTGLTTPASEAAAAARAAEKVVLDTAESTYFATSGCYTDAPGLVSRGILASAPSYWTISTGPGPCPSSYTLVPRSP